MIVAVATPAVTATPAAAATAAAALGPAKPAPATPAALVRQAPAEILARYSAALAKVREPKIVIFDYSVEQLGLRDLVQTHRIYRSGGRERDETRIVDGYTLAPPAIRTLAVGKDRYAVTSLAPRPPADRFAFAGITYRAGRPQYVFDVAQRAARPFRVTQVEIDARAYLPTIVRFDVRTASARGTAEISYDRAGSHWLVKRAEASVALADGKPARERIVFSAYGFPRALPATVFESSHVKAPAATPLPLATPTPIVFPLAKPAPPI